MGCSSSSAQTVDQEKRPGTKPEETKGDTVAVSNGIIAEDAQTIEDQMQLPVQTALPEDLQPGTDDEAGAVLVALEAQEDLGSGEDLLAAPEPQPEPVVHEEPAPVAATSEASTEPEAVVVGVEALLSVEELAPMENAIKALVEATGEAADDVVVQKEAPAFVEEVPVLPAEAAPEPAVSEPAEAAVVVEEATTLATEAPADVAAPVEAPTKNVAPETTSTIPAESTETGEMLEPAAKEAAAPGEAIEPGEAAAPGEAREPGEAAAPDEDTEPGKAAAPGEESAPHESSPPVEAAKPVIDTEIAVATIPEMPPLTEIIEIQAEPQPAVEEVLDTPVGPAETVPPAETPSSTETTPALAPEVEATAAEVAQVVEAPASTSETPEEVAPEALPANVTSEEATAVVSEVPLAPAPAADPAPAPLLEVVSTTEASQEAESEKTKKED